MTPAELQRLRDLANAATPGPWQSHRYEVTSPDNDVADDVACPYDAAFIAAAREAVPALIAEVERLRALVPPERFPVLAARGSGCGLSTVPWAMLAPHEPQARRNHGQSFQRLAERGGLSVREILAVLDGVPWAEPPVDVDELRRRVEAFESKSDDAAGYARAVADVVAHGRKLEANWRSAATATEAGDRLCEDAHAVEVFVDDIEAGAHVGAGEKAGT